MQRTGLNWHRRGYAIKEAASGVHSQDVGSYWARSVSIFINFILSSSFSSSIFPSHNKCHLLNPITHECQKHSTSTDTIALSRAYDPYILVIREFKELDKTSPTHAAKYQTTPINLMHKYSSNCKTQLKRFWDYHAPVLALLRKGVREVSFED